jgi:ATP-dependent Clp protease adaptor protein ClpS
MLLNDDHTPMDFVVDGLQELFEMEHEEAVQLMLRVHNEGAGECGVFAEEVARMKVEAVLALAREHQHRLQCVMERRQST